MRSFLSTILFFVLLISFGQTLPMPTVVDGVLCGAGTVVLSSSSTVDSPDLVFDWFWEKEGGLEYLGSIEASQGESQFITPYLIKSEVFYVGARIGSQKSELVSVGASIQNTVSVLESPQIELCGSVELHANPTFPSDEIQSYQWQELVANEAGEATYIDLPGEIQPTLLTTELGFYRALVTNLDECVAISTDLEVTDDRFIYAKPVGDGQHCFLVDNPFTHEVKMSSEYGRDITQYFWESSDDGINFYDLSIESEVTIIKPISIVSNTSTYYRLTVREQNCSVTSEVFSIDWRLMPEGTISHLNPVIGADDFFFCDTDAENSRTLVASTTSGVSTSWARFIFFPGLSLDFIKGDLRTFNPHDPQYSQFFNGPEIIGTGESIVLNQSHGGLIFAQFTNDLTGCVNYSSNGIFADTALPYPLENEMLAFEEPRKVCEENGILTFTSYDQTVDTYSWKRWDEGNGLFDEIGNESSLILDASVESLAGKYVLEVSKSGCTGESLEFTVEEDELVDAVIEVVDGTQTIVNSATICLGEEIILSSKNIDPAYEYRWYDFSISSEPIGSEETLLVRNASRYYLEVINGTCSGTLSDMFDVEVIETPKADLSFDGSVSNETICQAGLLEVVNPNTEFTYQWFFSLDNNKFDPIADEIDVNYYVNKDGFYFVEVTNSSNCTKRSKTVHVPSLLDANLNISGSVEICEPSDHAFLIANTTVSTNEYQWLFSPDEIAPFELADGLSNTFYYEANQAGFYILRISNEDCTAQSEVIEVVNSNTSDFEVSVEGNPIACTGSTVSLTANPIETSSVASYSWFFSLDDENYQLFAGEEEREITFQTDRFDSNDADEFSVFFKVGLTENTCSSLSTSFEVTFIRQPEIEVRNSYGNNSQDFFFCENVPEGLELEAFQVSSNLNLNYQWSKYNALTAAFEDLLNENNKSYIPTEAGRFRCTSSTSFNECISISNEIRITTLPTEIIADETFCFGSEMSLSADLTNVDDEHLDKLIYKWYAGGPADFLEINGKSGSSLVIDSGEDHYGAGSFFYEASYQDCELRSDTITVYEDPNSFEVSIFGETEQFKGIPFELNIETDEEDILGYVWSPLDYFIDNNVERGLIKVPESFEGDELTITVLATSSNGCSAEASILIQLADVPEAIFSKLVTPNGDGLNDRFIITGVDKETANHLVIFDNWGNTIYQASNYYNEPGQSEFLLNSVEEGVYYYLFTSEGFRKKGSFYVKK